MPHLDADTLAAYVDGRLAVEELGDADRHIDECRSCRLELSSLAAINSQPNAPESEAAEGTLGRYHVLRELGRGSMGIVLRAYDPELARPVALKLVREVDASTRELLRREARALARLRHPNVVTIYDVNADANALYVAMELVEGDTLRGFCRGRSVVEILAACADAGRGLAAAHDGGVIHRDFKPENVLCSGSGEVKVSDFGLARDAGDANADGALCGTPAYMAPEVLRREPATERSDQFSYSVSVAELLTGQRPTGGELVGHDALPSWVVRVLRRGLSRDPATRFPSMHAMVAALEDDPRVRWRRRATIAAGAIAALATGALIVQLVPLRSEPRCAFDTTALGDAWSPARNAMVTAAVTAASDADTATRVARALDQHAARWVASRREACVATHERGDQSTAVLARRVACLDRNGRELSALTSVLASADRKLAGIAQEVVGRLGDPEACTASDDVLPDDAAGRVAAEHARTVLARANALQYAGKLDEADALASELSAALASSPRLAAHALFVRARVASDRGQHDRAEALLFEALHAAERGRDDVLSATLWVEIVVTTGAQKHRFDLALSNARAADAALARIEPSTDLKLRYSYAFGALLLSHGKLDAARERFEQGLALGASDPRQQVSLGLIEIAQCDVLRQQAKLPAARELCATGMKRLETGLGPNNIRVAIASSIVAALAFTERDLAAAERTHVRALDIFTRRHALDHPVYGLTLANLGSIYSERDDLVRARDYFVRSLAVFDEHHPSHPRRMAPLQGLANLALRTGDAAAAITYYVQIRDIRAATYAPEHPDLLAAYYNLALAYRANKQPEAAQKVLAEMVERALAPGKESWALAARALDLAGMLAGDQRDERKALALYERALAAISHTTNRFEKAFVQRHIAETHLRLRRPERAIALLEEALATYEQDNAAQYDLGATRFLLGRALWESARDQPRAIEMMIQAQDELARAMSGPALEVYRSNVARYLRKHRK